MIGSRAYLAVGTLEVVALVAGALVLGSLGEGAYVPEWYAAVVGAHFSPLVTFSTPASTGWVRHCWWAGSPAPWWA